MPDSRFLAGASAAVTGGGHGIGRAIALRLAGAGAKVAIDDVETAMLDGQARPRALPQITAGDMDAAARRDYHRRAFGRD